MLIVSFSRPDAVYLAFPIASLCRASAAKPAGDDLVDLLGSYATGVLRNLDTRLTMGQLAALLEMAPSTLTGVCDELQRERHRTGRTVTATRTRRAERLMDLMAE